MNPDTVAAIFRRNMTALVDDAAAARRRRVAAAEAPDRATQERPVAA